MKRGFFVGFGLTVWRILRCNPFCAGGYDPVPPKKIPKYRKDKKDGEVGSLSEDQKSDDNDETPNNE